MLNVNIYMESTVSPQKDTYQMAYFCQEMKCINWLFSRYLQLDWFKICLNIVKF
jgi:hypothetical protein